YGPVDAHASSGIQIDFNDSDRSRIRYAGGVTLRLIEPIAFLVGVVGSSKLQTDPVLQHVTDFISEGTFSNVITTPVPKIVTRNVHTDIVDLNLGFKISPFGPEHSVVGFATVFVPLNDDGLRADAIPAVGVEVGF